MLEAMVKVFIFLLVFVISGCSVSGVNTPFPPTQTQIVLDAQNLWTYPLVLPKQVEGIEVGNAVETGSARRLCVDLSEFQIWEPGNYGDDVNFQIQRTTQIEINGIPVAHDNLEFAELTILLSRQDQNGNVVGSHGGGVSACFSALNFANGLNLGSITFQATSGNQYAYQWAFKVVRSGNKIAVEIPASIRYPS